MDTEITKLYSQIFDSNYTTYAVIDGASAPMLLGKLHSVEYSCLLRGELSLDLAEAAPYLVKLKENSDFTNWLIEYCQSRDCCIYIQSMQNLFSVRKHCRSLLKAELPDKSVVLFRFYDPRVFKPYMTACVDENDSTPFGTTVTRFTCQTTTGTKVWDNFTS